MISTPRYRPFRWIPVAFAIGMCVAADRVSGAPLHPDLLRLPSAEILRIPPEPGIPVAPPGLMETAGTTNGRPWSGHPRLLVLLVDFSDRPIDPVAFPLDRTRSLLFSQGVEPYGSLREWYLTATYGRIEFQGEVFGWFRMPLPYAEYANGQSGLCPACYPGSADGMVVHAVTAALAAGIDLGDFDNDGPDGIPGSGDDDGILDGLAVVFAGVGAERTGSLEDIRSHYGQIELDLESGGVRIPDYVTFPGEENVGVAVHEVGHLLGAPDLYDSSQRGNGLGYYSVMAYGLWFNNAREPGGPDPYTRMLWGVLEPERLMVDEPGLSLAPILDAPEALRLWTRGAQGPEYFLLEYRVARGQDRFLFGDGLLLYHVNESAGYQSNPTRYLVGLVQADGLSSLEGQEPRNLGEFGDYFPGLGGVRDVDDDTVPSTRASDGSPSEVAVLGIGDPGPRLDFDAYVGRFIASGPAPRLTVLPAAGLFEGGVRPGVSEAVRLQISNLGSRLPAGQLRLVSRDPRVVLVEPGAFPVLSLAALQSMTLPNSIEVEVRGVRDDEPALVSLEAIWEGPSASWNLAAPIPLTGNTLRRDSFEEASPDVASAALPGSAGNPWKRLLTQGFGGTGGWGTPSYGPTQNGVLVLGPLELSSGISEVRFRHRVDLHAFGELAYDGGFLEALPDGGQTWIPLEPVGGYPHVFGFSQGNDYPGLPVWSGNPGAWEEVVVPVTFTGSVHFRFHFVSDFTASGETYGGWQVDDLMVRTWTQTHAIFVDPIQVTGDRAEVPFEVRRMFDAQVDARVTLVREAGAQEVVLGVWDVAENLVDQVVVTDLTPWRVERLWFQFENGDRWGPLLVGPAEGSRARLLDPTPTFIRRGSGEMLHYRIPGTTAARIVLDLYDVRGARVARLEDGVREPGSHVHAGFPGRDVPGALGAGVYFLRLVGDGFQESRRLIVLP